MLRSFGKDFLKRAFLVNAEINMKVAKAPISE
jgi:hypothetical protein